ncbi:MAG: DUF502 domain-containing protein [Deltaproteobacteria bacterium]|jgi:uncharacterized membrane protein|nr:DUF502 domain-containing protein [Deltaproteobacteria bacterium]MBN2846424.1 DUF502 domain-containing protein [Deltaproteobacteria bacterium]
MRKKIKSILLTGFAAMIPVGVTLYIIAFLIRTMDNLVKIIPHRFQPDELLGFHIPGLGIIITLILIFIIGLVTKSYLGRKAVSLGEWIVDKIPFVSGIYKGVKQLVDAIFSDKHRSFRKAVLIEYPRRGLYSIAFVTGDSQGEVQEKTAEKHINLFVPTTPNPTSGFYIMIPENDIIPLDMSVEEAFSLIISGGIISPNNNKKNGKNKNNKKA